VEGKRIVALCGGGKLAILALEIDGAPLDAAGLRARFGSLPVALT
jgi:hypothetical protein